MCVKMLLAAGADANIKVRKATQAHVVFYCTGHACTLARLHACTIARLHACTLARLHAACARLCALETVDGSDGRT